MKQNLTALMTATAIAAACSGADDKTFKTDTLGIPVTPEENREYSYTDKKAGYWYGTTHQESTEWWSGWNMAKKRILADYTIGIINSQGMNTPLNRSEALECTVYPERLERRWADAEETFYMVDEKPVLYLAVKTEADSIFCNLDMSHIADKEISDYGVFFTPKEALDKRILLSPAAHKEFIAIPEGIKTVAGSEGFLLTYGTKDECIELAETFRYEGSGLLAARKARINSLITEYNPVSSNLPELDNALDWITITMDELITEQQGNGIYAGLPWFNEYWGRDMFISMPGACLVTGQFDIAKLILKDFAKLQDTDPASETYGRIPNRANLEGILYNTTDGTPRFVIQALEVSRYSGDTEFLSDIYPAIKISIDASIDNYTDDKGYLTHADADTWMDVKRNGIPGSPRGDRANDIQALWYDQLMAGTDIARIMNDEASASRWEALAQKLAENFENDYCSKEDNIIYDHLNADGSPDIQFRPNQLYCYDLIEDEAFKQKVTRRIWENSPSKFLSTAGQRGDGFWT